MFIAPVTLYCVGLLHFGLDRPISLANGIEVLVYAAESIFLSEVFYIAGTGIIKVSFGFTLLRFLQEKTQKMTVKIVMLIEGVMTTIIFFVFLFNCMPVSYSWTRARDPYYLAVSAGIDPSTLHLSPKGSCIAATHVIQWNYVHASFMIFADVMLGLVVPIWVIKGLHMTPRLKITTCAVLAFGALASVATIIRFTYIQQLNQTPNFAGQAANIADAANFLITANPACLWTYIEFALCIIGANCSTLKPLAKKLHIFSESKPSTMERPEVTIGGARGQPQLNTFHSAHTGSDLEAQSGHHDVWDGRKSKDADSHEEVRRDDYSHEEVRRDDWSF